VWQWQWGVFDDAADSFDDALDLEEANQEAFLLAGNVAPA
jgi:hypothetical protein